MQRAELDRLEEVAVAEMVKEDGEYQAFTGTNLEQDIEFSEAEPLNDIAAFQQDDFWNER